MSFTLSYSTLFTMVMCPVLAFIILDWFTSLELLPSLEPLFYVSLLMLALFLIFPEDLKLAV